MSANAKTHWSKAVQSASDRPEMLAALANIVGRWGWTNEVEDVLEATVEKFPREPWAALALEKDYYLKGDTHGLLSLYSGALRQQPKDPGVMNNVATVSLLLRTNLTQAHALARDAFAVGGTNVAVASTYALSLYLQGKTNEALGVLDKFKESDLRQGSIAAYYAVLLEAVGAREKAKPYRALGEKALLLPQERAMLEQIKK